MSKYNCTHNSTIVHNRTYYGAFLSLVLADRCSFEVVETVYILAADKGVYRISVAHNEIPVDADISVFDDSCMDPVTVADCAGAHLAAVDCNSAVEFVPHPVEMATMAVDYQMKEHANVVHQSETLQRGVDISV